jgi:urease accessory protein
VSGRRRGAQASVARSVRVRVLFVTVALAAALVVAIRAPWGRIAVRVAGSWIVAMGLLLLGWSFRAA